MIDVKICGLKDSENLKVAVEAGARFVGFVFVPSSPRCIDAQEAAELMVQLPKNVQSVGLFVNPDDEALTQVLNIADLDMIQLHGDESPARVADIQARFGKPVIKAIRVGGHEDLKCIPDYESVADWLLFDSKSGQAQGGTGECFDWSLLAGQNFTKPWMLSGGLNSENVQKALQILRPTAVDVSSGVEVARGQKDPGKIKAFIHAAKTAI